MFSFDEGGFFTTSDISDTEIRALWHEYKQQGNKRSTFADYLNERGIPAVRCCYPLAAHLPVPDYSVN